MPSRKFLNFSDAMVVGRHFLKWAFCMLILVCVFKYRKHSSLGTLSYGIMLYGKAGGGSFLSLPISYIFRSFLAWLMT